MKLLTKPIREKLIANGKAQDLVRGTEDEIDFEPVVKLFNPCGAATWLLTELDSEDPDIAFGLCDLGMQCPELGSVRISELESVRGPLGLGIERARSSLDAQKDPHGLCPRSVEVWMHCCVSWSAVAAWSTRPGATVSVPKRSVCVRDRMQGKKHSETESDILFQVRLRPIADVTAVPDKCMVFAASN